MIHVPSNCFNTEEEKLKTEGGRRIWKQEYVTFTHPSGPD